MISTSRMIQEFIIEAGTLEILHGVSIQLLHRAGNRLEHAAGRTLDDMSAQVDGHVLVLSDEWSARVYPWQALSQDAKRKIEHSMRVLEIRCHDWTREEIVRALESDVDELDSKADLLRAVVCGDEIHRRGLIEISNYCAKDCHYCGLRRSNSKLQRYRMTQEEVLSCAQDAKSLGYGSVVLQSGEDVALSTESLSRIVEKIKEQTNLAVTISVGEKTREDYRRLKTAGADRYLLRFETSNRELFERLRPGTTFERRLECLADLDDLGYQVGSGCMIGIPGQTTGDLADDLLLMRKLDLDMAGVGPFIPHPETPLKDAEAGSLDLVLKFIALVRLVTKNTHIPATTALGSIHPTGRQMALTRGANVIMPNVTPQNYRKYYEIYPNKICITEKPSDCSGCTGGMIHSLGRTIGHGPGHSLKKTFKESSS